MTDRMMRPTICESIWGHHPKRTSPAEHVECPTCKSLAKVSYKDEEVHVICECCGMVAIDGSIVVKGLNI